MRGETTAVSEIQKYAKAASCEPYGTLPRGEELATDNGNGVQRDLPERDIVDLLGAWLAHNHSDIIRQARDEITRLREPWRSDHPVFWDDTAVSRAIAHARAEALEEAAQACLAWGEHSVDTIKYTCRQCAADIRALKDKPHG